MLANWCKGVKNSPEEVKQQRKEKEDKSIITTLWLGGDWKFRIKSSQIYDDYAQIVLSNSNQLVKLFFTACQVNVNSESNGSGT